MLNLTMTRNPNYRSLLGLKLVIGMGVAYRSLNTFVHLTNLMYRRICLAFVAAAAILAKDKPTLTVWLAPADKANGCAVVVCPGGGYGHLAVDHEGKQIAEFLNSLGVSAFMLKYCRIMGECVASIAAGGDSEATGRLGGDDDIAPIIGEPSPLQLSSAACENGDVRRESRDNSDSNCEELEPCTATIRNA